jgi:hypothetical protein
MKNYITIVLLALLTVLAVSAFAEVGTRHEEKAGGFSYCAPKDWSFKKFNGLPYSVVLGPVVDNYPSNISIIDEQFDGTLKKYVDNVVADGKKKFENFLIISRSNFETTAGLSGEVIVYTAKQGKFNLRQTQYFFAGPDKQKITFTCSVLVKDGEKFSALFTESMKTFEFITQE